MTFCVKVPPTTAGSSATINPKSGRVPVDRSDAYIPAALNPFGVVVPPPGSYADPRTRPPRVRREQVSVPRVRRPQM